MDTVDVEVHILPKFGAPNFSLTAKQLGARLSPSGRLPGHVGQPSDVWEVVRLVDGRATLDPQEVAQTDKCNFVKALSIRVDFGLEYFIASELQSNINIAANESEKLPHSAAIEDQTARQGTLRAIRQRDYDVGVGYQKRPDEWAANTAKTDVAICPRYQERDRRTRVRLASSARVSFETGGLQLGELGLS
jgi:hypothetical protein